MVSGQAKTQATRATPHAVLSLKLPFGISGSVSLESTLFSQSLSMAAKASKYDDKDKLTLSHGAWLQIAKTSGVTQAQCLAQKKAGMLGWVVRESITPVCMKCLR